ncbi:MAG: L-seryl-tRNA(Sec) selenium transferase [Planctomycetota bacterium]|nr:MAG: L-seryl-tRNA(Sec) selenium transferase [Planctomycetota bacterium]
MRDLPSVSSLLEHQEVRAWLDAWPRETVVLALRTVLDEARRELLDGERQEAVSVEELLAGAESFLLERSVSSLTRVINATGVVLHTGLGRAPLPEAAIEAVTESAAGYCNLEYDLDSGRRGRRMEHVEGLLRDVTGAEAALVVNNNAAATLLILTVLAAGREVIVSRGQLIEIGDAFRLPDIMRAGGAVLREVGTTNRTRVSDYAAAINERTALILRVHTSNYRIVGFTESAPLAELAELAHAHNLPLVDDLGSGALFDPGELGLPSEPSARESIRGGADLVCFSGDKLVGGPQCGLIVGRAALIESLSRHPLMRTYRVDKLTLAALEATLRLYQNPQQAAASIPVWSMLTASPDELARRARALAEMLQAALPEESFLVGSDESYAGGGTLPQRPLPTVVVRWRPRRGSVSQMAAALRRGDPPVIVRISEEAVCFDLRTIREEEFEAVAETVTAAVWDHPPDQETDGTSLPVIS